MPVRGELSSVAALLHAALLQLLHGVAPVASPLVKAEVVAYHRMFYSPVRGELSSVAALLHLSHSVAPDVVA